MVPPLGKSLSGLPSLVVAIAANQLPFAEALHQAGHLQFLGDGASVTSEQIRSTLLHLMTEPKLENAVTALTDGWGAPRLAIAMLGPQVQSVCGQLQLRTNPSPALGQ